MDEEVFIPEESKMFEQAYAMADMEARQKGFKKGSSKWHAAVQKFLLERYMHSSIPHIENPGTPHVPELVYKKFDRIFGPGGFIARHVGFADGPKTKGKGIRNGSKILTAPYYQYEVRARKAITDLVHIYMELEFGYQASDLKSEAGDPLKASSYRIETGASKQDSQEVLTRQYLRYTSTVMVLSLMNIFYSVSRNQMMGIMEDANRMAKKEIPMGPYSKTGKDPRAYLLKFLDSVKKIFVSKIQIR